ncbi:MAG: iron-containing alcohol dehydrogenase [Dehalococcoidales bacterium]|nr:iron-containing alcohol dehydrogenase [Dehalococcoidales bacterium]
MENYEIRVPGKVRFGAGCTETMGEEATKIGAKRALMVTDPGVFQTGITDPVKENLTKAGIKVDVFSEAEPEPTYSKLNATAKKLGKNKYDLVVAIGGGSSIDTAKGLSILFAHDGIGQDYGGTDKVPGPGVPLFACPTTAGTGSEVTNIAVFDDRERGFKEGIVSNYLLARIAFVDPTLTYGCPPKVTAASGMDALIHAVEGYTGNKATTFSDAMALEAMRLITGSLRRAVKNGADKEARNQMSEGALFGGMAFMNSGVTAVHALAFPLGSQFHVPHGMANAVLLPYVMECNLSANLSRFATVARMLGVATEGLSDQEAAEKGLEAAKSLSADVGIPTHLRELGVPKEALEGLASATMNVTRLLANNPKPLTLDDVRKIWENAW